VTYVEPEGCGRGRGLVRQQFVVGSVLAVLVVLAASVAEARADTEPNDRLVQAEGPILGGVDVAGSLPDGDRADWYVLYVQGQHQLHLNATVPGPEYDRCVSVTLHDADGAQVSSDLTTLPGLHRYFVSAAPDSCWQEEGGRAYSFRLEPGPALVGGAPMPTPTGTGEPNENALQAAGPLTGGLLYSGTTDTSNDEDWFFLHTAPGTHQLDLSAYGAGLGGAGCRWSWDESTSVSLYEADGDEIGSASAGADEVGHFTHTSATSAKLLVRASAGCLGGTWMFRIDPAGALTSSLTTGASAAPTLRCASARRSVARWTRRVSATRRALRRAQRPSARRALRRELAAERRVLRRVRARADRVC